MEYIIPAWLIALAIAAVLLGTAVVMALAILIIRRRKR